MKQPSTPKSLLLIAATLGLVLSTSACEADDRAAPADSRSTETVLVVEEAPQSEPEIEFELPEPTIVEAVAVEETETTDYAAVLAVLDTLEVKGRAPKTGYDRDMFGPKWADVDRNGCDTRNDILTRDLTDVTYKEGTKDCVVLKGTLEDPYTATTIEFERGQDTSSAVQIDHVVALSDAWQKGAQQLTPDLRTEFANDPLNLLAVDGPANAQKSDSDAASWLPPNKAFRCDFVSTQVLVKAKYSLWVTEAERDRIATLLATCIRVQEAEAKAEEEAEAARVAEEQAAAEAAAEAARVAEEQAAAEAAAKAAEEAEAARKAEEANVAVYYKNCSEARAAGAAPVYRGDPGYGKHLDRDNDGIGCE